MAEKNRAPWEWHRAHDYRYLIRRWRAAIRNRGLKTKLYGELDNYPVYFMETRKPLAAHPWIYLSAGIHGDEAGATEGLLRWVETTSLPLEELNLLIFPCLNPWGLVNNSRGDRSGADLNRAYHDVAIPATAAHLEVLSDRRFELAITLHEDYDAAGIYIYEVQTVRPFWGESLLKAASEHVPVETRTRVEGRACTNGIIRRRIKPDVMPLRPEALHLAFEHAHRVFTVETPSELDIRSRAQAQIAVLDQAIRYCRNEHRSARPLKKVPRSG